MQEECACTDSLALGSVDDLALSASANASASALAHTVESFFAA